MTSIEQYAPLVASKLVANMAEVDKKAATLYGIAGVDLMETAGRAIAQKVLSWASENREPEKTDILILCGPGNNGGDGFVCARHLLEAGLGHIAVWYAENSDKPYSNDALTNLLRLQAIQNKYPDFALKAWPSIQEQGKSLNSRATSGLNEHPVPTIAVDALFGSGLNKAVTGIYADWIEWLNHCHTQQYTKVLAVDVPSGLNSKTGEILGQAVLADATITLAAGKPALYLETGRQYAGSIDIVDIGIPQQLIDEDESAAFLISQAFASQGIPVRTESFHKYQMGHVLVIAGSSNMPGAAKLCAEAALSAGAGMVTLAAPKSLFSAIELAPELIRLPLAETAEGWLNTDILATIQPVLAKTNAIVIGPGLGQQPETQQALNTLIQALSKEFPGYIIIDADGLNALAQAKPALKLSERFILTPHIGEAKRLAKAAGIPQEDSDMVDRCSFANSLSRAFQSLLVLKSASTIVSDGNWSAINPTGNNGMATAGSGDVLSGLIGGIIAQHQANQDSHLEFSKPNPLLSAVYLHGLSGDYAAGALGVHCLRASHLIQYLPEAFFNLKLVSAPNHKPNYKTGRTEALSS